MLYKFKKCQHITLRIYPESDGNKCFECGYIKYNNIPEVIEYNKVRRLIKILRFKKWILDSLNHEQLNKHRHILPKRQLSIIGSNLMPLGHESPPSSGNYVTSNDQSYIEEI